MWALILTLIVIAFAFVYTAVFRLVKKTRFYKGIEQLYVRVQKIPDKPRTKGDVRRLKKHKHYLKSFKRRMLSLMFLNFAVFIAIYSVMLYVFYNVINALSIYTLKSPISIPFLSIYDPESGVIVIHVYSILILALAATSYLISRELRLHS